jgi:tRNA A-37 threonylcarbamoyl transferase component Bud32
MSPEQLQETLTTLDRNGTRIGEDQGREIWEFSFAGRPYRVWFYPRARSGRSDGWAVREFRGLMRLQRSKIPAVHAVAFLPGFSLGARVGDALVVDHFESAVTLDGYLWSFVSRGESVPLRRDLERQVRAIALQLARAKLGHHRLELGNLMLQGRTLYLAGGEHVRGGGLRMEQILRLGYSAEPFATRTEIMRAWQALGPGSPLPRGNPVAERLWNRKVRQSFGDNEEFGRLTAGPWRGHFTRQTDRPMAWAASTRIVATDEMWQRAWPALLARIEADQLQIIKRGDSGDVLAGEVVLGGKPIPIIVKRPRRKRAKQFLMDLGRISRARRTWLKTWKMTVRGIPCEWPMLLMEKRTLGYVTDAVIVFGRVAGPTLAAIDLNALQPSARDTLFRRVGRVLRRIEELGFTHFDAKSTNWIVFEDSATTAGPTPVLVDVDGVRHYRWEMAGIQRLLRAMRQHPQYTPADSLVLCQGYAPAAGAAGKSEVRNPKTMLGAR